MKYIKSIFAVSIIAMAVVGNARASIVSQTNIVSGSNVSVTVPKSGNNAGKVVISATDTKYDTGTATVSGTTKLYTGAGTATDGTMTQNAITTALNGKLSTTGTAAKATADASGNTITSTYATKTELDGKQDKSAMVDSTSDKLTEDNETNYPTVAAVYDIANAALGSSIGAKLDKKFTGEADKSKAVITDKDGNITTGTISSAIIKDANVTTAKVADGAITTAKIANGTILEEDLSDAVKNKLNATVQTFNPATATAGQYVTNFTKDGTTVTATTAYVQIPVGSATAPTGVASIWVE